MNSSPDKYPAFIVRGLLGIVAASTLAISPGLFVLSLFLLFCLFTFSSFAAGTVLKCDLVSFLESKKEHCSQSDWAPYHNGMTLLARILSVLMVLIHLLAFGALLWLYFSAGGLKGTVEAIEVYTNYPAFMILVVSFEAFLGICAAPGWAWKEFDRHI